MCLTLLLVTQSIKINNGYLNSDLTNQNFPQAICTFSPHVLLLIPLSIR